MNLMKNLNFNFIVIYIIHKMLVLLKNKLNYIKDNIFECFFKELNRRLCFFKKLTFFITYTNGKFRF